MTITNTERKFFFKLNFLIIFKLRVPSQIKMVAITLRELWMTNKNYYLTVNNRTSGLHLVKQVLYNVHTTYKFLSYYVRKIVQCTA